MLKEWLEIYGHDIEENGGSIQSMESIETNISHKMQKMHQLSNVFFLKWLSLIYPETIAKLNTTSFVNSGSCLCGNIKYKLKQPRKIVNCHCGECRKFHGNYAAYTQVLKSNIEITNEEDVSWYQQTKEKAKRGWCRICGSSLFWMPINSDSICVAAGTLEVPCNLKTTKHIYVNNKSDYYTIDDGLEKYPGTMYAEHVA